MPDIRHATICFHHTIGIDTIRISCVVNVVAMRNRKPPTSVGNSIIKHGKQLPTVPDVDYVRCPLMGLPGGGALLWDISWATATLKV